MGKDGWRVIGTGLSFWNGVVLYLIPITPRLCPLILAEGRGSCHRSEGLVRDKGFCSYAS